MARIFVAFYNCMNETDDPNAMPAFYETFLRGLNEAGNEVKICDHKYFDIADFPSINTNPEMLDSIKKFDPQVCFLFNNYFYDISEIVDCPIVVYEVDSPNFYSNINILKQKKDRFIHFVFQSSSREMLINDFGVEDKYIFDVPFFTEVHASDTEFERNIGFIGSNFVDMSRVPSSHILTPNVPLREKMIYYKMLDIVEENPNCDAAVIKSLANELSPDVFKVFSDTQIKNAIMNELSGEKRLRLLGTIRPLGLEIFGTQNWGNQYYGNTELNRCFNPTRIYTKAQNEYVYNTSKIGINVSHLQAVTGFPWRIMDILASNACLVTDYHEEFERVFGDICKLIPVYETPGEAYALCLELLCDEEKRSYISLACREFVETRYRFTNCLKLMEQYTGVLMH